MRPSPLMGKGGVGGSFQEGELEYTFSLRGPDCSVSPDRNCVLKWEVSSVITRESEKLLGDCVVWKKKKKLRWICFSLVVILPLIYLLSKARLWSRGLMTPAAPYLITGWRFDACGGKMEDDGRVLLWNADQSNASCEFGPNITDLLHFPWHLSLDWFPIW